MDFQQTWRDLRSHSKKKLLFSNKVIVNANGVWMVVFIKKIKNSIFSSNSEGGNKIEDTESNSSFKSYNGNWSKDVSGCNTFRNGLLARTLLLSDSRITTNKLKERPECAALFIKEAAIDIKTKKKARG
jgi:hypothetical protein